MTASHQWGTRHWTKPQGEPRRVILINSATDPWRARVDGRAADWSQANKFKLSVEGGNTGQDLRQSCPFPDKFRRVRVCDYRYDNPNWIGQAQIFRDGPHIQLGRVRLDNADLNLLTADGQQHVICQEIGHNLGLTHWNSDGNNSCMHTSHVNNEAYDQAAPHDLSQLDNQTHYHGGSGGNFDNGDFFNQDNVLNCLLGCQVDSSAMRISGGHAVGERRVSRGHKLTVNLNLSPMRADWLGLAVLG